MFENLTFCIKNMKIFLLQFPNLSRTNRHQKASYEPMPINFGHLKKMRKLFVYLNKPGFAGGKCQFSGVKFMRFFYVHITTFFIRINKNTLNLC